MARPRANHSGPPTGLRSSGAPKGSNNDCLGLSMRVHVDHGTPDLLVQPTIHSCRVPKNMTHRKHVPRNRHVLPPPDASPKAQPNVYTPRGPPPHSLDSRPSNAAQSIPRPTSAHTAATQPPGSSMSVGVHVSQGCSPLEQKRRVVWRPLGRSAASSSGRGP